MSRSATTTLALFICGPCFSLPPTRRLTKDSVKFLKQKRHSTRDRPNKTTPRLPQSRQHVANTRQQRLRKDSHHNTDRSGPAKPQGSRPLNKHVQRKHQKRRRHRKNRSTRSTHVCTFSRLLEDTLHHKSSTRTHTFALARGCERGVAITPHTAPSKSQVYGAHAGQTGPTSNKRYARIISKLFPRLWSSEHTRARDGRC